MPDKTTLEAIAILVIGALVLKRMLVGPQRRFAVAAGVLLFAGIGGILLSPTNDHWLRDAGALTVLGGLCVVLLMVVTELVHYLLRLHANLKD